MNLQDLDQQAGGPHQAGKEPQIGLMATCLVDLFRPSVGFAAAELLIQAGCHVHVPANQTCCGQPAYNSGDRDNARALSRQVIAMFEKFDYVVVPSGSCAGMIKHHYPEILKDDPDYLGRAIRLAGKTYELTSFLVDICEFSPKDCQFKGRVSLHDSCAGLREMKVKSQPRKLINAIEGAELVEMADSHVCCGFGGTFCVKYGQLSDAIVAEKVKNILASEADYLVAGDLGCLMNIAGKLSRQGADVKLHHIAEILADMYDGGAIAASPDQKS